MVFIFVGEELAEGTAEVTEGEQAGEEEAAPAAEAEAADGGEEPTAIEGGDVQGEEAAAESEGIDPASQAMLDQAAAQAQSSGIEPSDMQEPQVSVYTTHGNRLSCVKGQLY